MPHLIQGIEAFSRGTQRIYINKYIYTVYIYTQYIIYIYTVYNIYIQYIIYIYSIYLYIYVKDLQKQEYSEYGRYENKL